MELFELDNFLGLRGVLLGLWLIIFIVSIFLIISGVKADRSTTRTVLIIFGILLAVLSLLLFVFTFFFGFNS